MNTLLVVLKEANQRMLCRMELERAGYRVVEAGGEEETLEAVRANRLDLVILDTHLGPYTQGATGLSTLREIQEIDDTLPVVVYTADSLFENDYTFCQADAYVFKSSNLDPLLHVVSSLLSRKEGTLV